MQYKREQPQPVWLGGRSVGRNVESLARRIAFIIKMFCSAAPNIHIDGETISGNNGKERRCRILRRLKPPAKCSETFERAAQTDRGKAMPDFRCRSFHSLFSRVRERKRRRKREKEREIEGERKRRRERDKEMTDWAASVSVNTFARRKQCVEWTLESVC